MRNQTYYRKRLSCKPVARNETSCVELSRACAKTGWQTKFPNVNVEAVAARGSKHNPLLINLEANKGPRHRQHQKIFRFEAMWTRSEECEDIVKDSWCGEVEGDARSRILQRTRRVVLEELIRWDRERFGHVRRRVRKLEEKLEAYVKDPISASDNSKRRALRGELDEFLTRKEILWKHRAKLSSFEKGIGTLLTFMRERVLGKRRILSLSSATKRVSGVILKKISS
ncbi:UNVERIFIED_CONTAM: hypothetical protein Sradi_5090600 [Sesamum radiatum]|uniref:Uncharacterized protein n=1 Tax=Sesamum radiatum TaxID=300843 RepID=A0AAW2M267_SESRA